MKMRRFDYKGFAKSLIENQFEVEYKRKSRVTTREIANEIMVSHTSVWRAMKAQPIHINTIIKLCDWSGRSIEDFIN